ncbi:tRNA dimethylallyltransferase isoform X2 [Venturia canescens]|nr:tRNA dimethylallyltransferase isoform X2 [Venturia canescens]
MAPHHMLDEVDPLVEYCVIDFRNKALRIMNDLVSRRKMPIIVGGTNYYIESLLWQILVEDPKESGNKFDTRNSTIKISPRPPPSPCRDESLTSVVLNERVKDHAKLENNENEDTDLDEIAAKRSRIDHSADPQILDPFFVSYKKMTYDTDEFTNEQLHQKLTEVDPDMAKRLHPNNRRKIIRSLQVFEEHGKKHSEILKDQRTAGGSGLGGPLRFPDSIILWLQCDQRILDERLSRRVDSMVEAGLVDELLDFHARYNENRLKTNTSPDYTKGIFQSIGFKEFHNYLVLPQDEKNSDKGEQLLKQGIDDLKMVTRRYARRQQRWIMNRFIRRIDRPVPPVYGLDCTNVEHWNSRVLEPAIAIVEAKLRNEEPNLRPLNENIDVGKGSDASNEESRWCETCEKILIGDLQWKAHMEGAKHRRVAQKKKRLQMEAALEEKTSLETEAEATAT